ncbi:MAG: ferredoxin, partial [Acidobacteriota bacterium]
MSRSNASRKFSGFGNLNRVLSSPLMQVTIERDECISCAACWEECPDFFEQSPGDNLSQVVEKYQ